MLNAGETKIHHFDTFGFLIEKPEKNQIPKLFLIWLIDVVKRACKEDGETFSLEKIPTWEFKELIEDEHNNDLSGSFTLTIQPEWSRNYPFSNTGVSRQSKYFIKYEKQRNLKKMNINLKQMLTCSCEGVRDLAKLSLENEKNEKRKSPYSLS